MELVSLRKILQILYYIQNNSLAVSDTKDCVMYLLKIVFFADRYHLRHYGSTITCDTYYAMKNGPVASAVFDVLKCKFPSVCNTIEMDLMNEIEQTGEYSVKIKEQKDDELSESEKEALDFSLREFGQYNQFALSDMTHDYPEWKNQEELLKNNARVEMSMESFFDNPSEIKNLQKYHKEDVFQDDASFLDCMKEAYLDDTNAS